MMDRLTNWLTDIDDCRVTIATENYVESITCINQFKGK